MTEDADLEKDFYDWDDDVEKRQAAYDKIAAEAKKKFQFATEQEGIAALKKHLTQYPKDRQLLGTQKFKEYAQRHNIPLNIRNLI